MLGGDIRAFVAELEPFLVFVDDFVRAGVGPVAHVLRDLPGFRHPNHRIEGLCTSEKRKISP